MTKIDASLRALVVQRFESGESAKACAAWLARTRGVRVTPQAVWKLANGARSEPATKRPAMTKRSASRTEPGRGRRVPSSQPEVPSGADARERSLAALRRRALALGKIVRRLEREVAAGPEYIDLYLRALEHYRRIREVLVRFSPPPVQTGLLVTGLGDLLHAAAERADDARRSVRAVRDDEER